MLTAALQHAVFLLLLMPIDAVVTLVSPPRRMAAACTIDLHSYSRNSVSTRSPVAVTKTVVSADQLAVCSAYCALATGACLRAVTLLTVYN
jgi:hypothetical protein